MIPGPKIALAVALVATVNLALGAVGAHFYTRQKIMHAMVAAAEAWELERSQLGALRTPVLNSKLLDDCTAFGGLYNAALTKLCIKRGEANIDQCVEGYYGNDNEIGDIRAAYPKQYGKTCDIYKLNRLKNLCWANL